MLVLKKSHYIAAIIVLLLTVCIAAWRGGNSAESTADSVPVSDAHSSISSEYNESIAETTSVSAVSGSGSEMLIGVWIPYMSLSTSQKSEAAFKANYDAKIETAKKMGCNAVYVHIRPFADSLYPSEYEPWSHILTGTQGDDPGYDPLAYMIEKAHENGMEFHAWINPLRISTGSTPSTLSEGSFYMQNKEEHSYYFIEYDGGIYYNPASAYIRQRIAESTAEIAANYNVDGIHFDDYFYPTEDESIDSNQYAAYTNETEEPLALHEWRTANINALIAAVYHKIKQVSPDTVFGISPQGNLDNNEKINADVYTWCAQSGYIDYICPQLYYSFENQALPYETALHEWSNLERQDSISFYVGLAAYKAGTDADDGTWLNTEDTIARQIQAAEAAGAEGIILYAIDYFDDKTAAAEMANAKIVIDSLNP